MLAGAALCFATHAHATELCQDQKTLARLMTHDAQPAPALQQEIWRILEWLKACSTLPSSDETLLYTWGHQKKLDRMLKSDRISFYEYDRSRQLTYNQLRNFDVVESVRVDRNQAVAAARSHVQDPNLHNLVEVARAFVHTDKLQIARHDALTLALWEHWLPGFLDWTEVPVDGRLEHVLGKLKGTDKASLSFQRAQGVQDGMQQFDERARSSDGRRNFRSSSSLGWGLSFSTSAVDFLNHFYDSNHMGLVCRLPANARRIMLNLDNLALQDTLRAARILLPKDRYGEMMGSNTMYARPAAFEEASKGFIVVSRAGANVGLVYTEKMVLDYRHACEPITLENFPCRDWPALLRHAMYIAGANGKPGIVQTYLQSATPGPNLPYARRVTNKTEACRQQGSGAGS